MTKIVNTATINLVVSYERLNMYNFADRVLDRESMKLVNDSLTDLGRIAKRLHTQDLIDQTNEFLLNEHRCPLCNKAVTNLLEYQFMQSSGMCGTCDHILPDLTDYITDNDSRHTDPYFERKFELEEL